MLKGFATPLTPKGRSGIVPPPPWTNAGIVLAIEYWTDPAAVKRFLPKGFQPASDPGHAIAHFCEWQSSSEGAEELLDPIRAQYNEFFLLIACRYEDRETYICPFMYVDNDINLYRGLIQGLPKQHAAIRMTRSYPVANQSGAALEAGTRLGATMTYRDRRLVEARVTLRQPAKEPIGLAASPVLGVRHFPDLAIGATAPLVHDIVAFAGYDRHVADIWTGTAELSMFPAPNQELADLKPRRVGRAARYAMGFSIREIRRVGDVGG
ncbi:MAG: acetoacetate decarboxylase family protein [Hyphomicrobiaceae bacterium]